MRGGYRIGAGRKPKGDNIRYSYTRHLTKQEMQQMDDFLERIRNNENTGNTGK